MLKWLIASIGFFAGVLALGFWLPLGEVKPAPSANPFVASSASGPVVAPTIPASRPVAVPSMSATAAPEQPVAALPDVHEEPAFGLDSQAIASLKQSLEGGDPRAPPMSASQPQERPTVDELDSPDAYLRYEMRQEQKLKRAFVEAADTQIPVLEQAIQEAKTKGLDASQLQEGEEKLARLRAMRDELLSQDPALTSAPPGAQ